MSEESAERPTGASAEEAAGKATEQGKAEGRTFGGLTPREAALRRHAKDRARREGTLEGDEAGDDRSDLITTPIRVGKIVRQLEGAAAKGDVQAARELRSWLDRYPNEGEQQLDLAALTARERSSILAYCLAELNEAPAQGDIREGTGDVLDAAPML